MHQCGAGGSELGDTRAASTIRLRPWTYRPGAGSGKRPNDPKIETPFTLRLNFDSVDKLCRLYTVHRIQLKQSACHDEVIGLSCLQHCASDGSRGLDFSDGAPCCRGSQTLICTGKRCATDPKGRGRLPVPAMRAPSLDDVAPMWGRRSTGLPRRRLGAPVSERRLTSTGAGDADGSSANGGRSRRRSRLTAVRRLRPSCAPPPRSWWERLPP